MDKIVLILFLCISLPMLPVLFLIRDRESRYFLGYLLVGLCICLISSELSSFLLGLFGGDLHYVTTNITPISEELLKGLPVLYFAWVIDDRRDLLLSCACACGLGFAVLENLILIVQNIDTVSVPWALTRGIGAPHSCTVPAPPLSGSASALSGSGENCFTVGRFPCCLRS